MKGRIDDRSSPESGVAFLVIRSSEIEGQVSHLNIPQIIIESEAAKKITFRPDEEQSSASESSEDNNDNLMAPNYGGEKGKGGSR